MLSELTRTIYDAAATDWQTAEKISYAVLNFLERKLPPEEYITVRDRVLGSAEYELPDRSVYPGYAGEVPDQVRPRELR